MASRLKGVSWGTYVPNINILHFSVFELDLPYETDRRTLINAQSL